METQSVQLPFFLYYQLSSADGPGRTVLCGGNAAKSSAVVISPPVLLRNGSSEHLE